MNYTKSSLPVSKGHDLPTSNQYQKIRSWVIKFWQFSLFYGDYLGSLHSRKDSSARK